MKNLSIENVETMKLLLHAGCDVNSVNIQGNTPLHLAVTFVPEPEQVEILKEMLELLLDLGADTKLIDKNGQTVIDCCETDEARGILSAKGGLGDSNIETIKVSPENTGTKNLKKLIMKMALDKLAYKVILKVPGIGLLFLLN